MNLRGKWAVAVVAGWVLASLPVTGGVAFAEKAEKKDQKNWSQKMKGLQKALQELLVDLSSDKRFEDPRNFKRIEQNALLLSKLAHDLKPSDPAAPAAKSPDSDPTIPIISSQFDQEAQHAYKNLKNGHRSYARGVLRSMTSYCIACHTRSGAPSLTPSVTDSALQALSGNEKAEFFAATRQFDRSLEEYERVIGDSKNAQTRPFEWEEAVRTGLAIAVRVKKDPDRALGIAEKVNSTPKAPFFLKEQATQWAKSIKDWKAEPSTKAMTEEGFYAKAVKLMAEAKSLQKYPADRSADVLYLRASAAVHDLMSFAPNGKHATEALYLAGLSYEVLDGLMLWDLHESYYVSCIKRAPHTEIARQCFRHYEQSVYDGYTGSGGMDIPLEVRLRLEDLDRLSKPEGIDPAQKKPL